MTRCRHFDFFLQTCSCYPGVKFQINIGNLKYNIQMKFMELQYFIHNEIHIYLKSGSCTFLLGCPALTRIKVLDIEMKFHKTFHNYSVGIYLPLIKQLHLGRNLTPWVPSLDWEASELFAFPPPPVFFHSRWLLSLLHSNLLYNYIPTGPRQLPSRP